MHRLHAQGEVHRQAIQLQAATAEGFAIAGDNKQQHHCDFLIKTGLLFRSRVNQKLVRYFTTQAAADKFFSVNSRLAVKPSYSIAQPKSDAVKLSADAVIVYTQKTRYSSRMMPDRFEVSAPFLRIGDADWSMRI